MGIATAATSRAAECLWALLDQSEDCIVKPKRALSTLNDISNTRNHWRSFCHEILQRPPDPEVDPHDRLLRVRERELQVYFRWRLQRGNIRKVVTLLQCVKNWCMMYKDDVGRDADQAMMWRIGAFTRTTLAKDFELDPTVDSKESTNENDLHHLLTYLWTQDTYSLPIERQRVQQGLITLLIALTTVRLGALVESGCYYGTNEALLYKNVLLQLVRNPEDRNQTVLTMQVTVMLWKGKREKMQSVTFVFYEHDCLMFCPILHMLALAFADNAFDSDCIKCAQDIYDLTIPDFKESLRLKWKEEWMSRPIFRRACSTAGGLITSLVKALPYASYAAHLNASGSGAGFRTNLTAYAFRRGAAQVVNKITTPAQQNLIMGHTNSSIFDKYYQNQTITTDISAAVLKTPSRSSLIASVGHIGIDRDPRAPQYLDPEEIAIALADKEYIAIQARIKELRSANYKKGKYPSENQTVTNQARKELLSAQNSARQRRKKLLREAASEKRSKFFDRIDNDDIRQIKQGVPVIYNPPPVAHVLQARRQIASIFGAPNQTNRRIEALQSLIELCHVREPHRMNPASRVSKGATCRKRDALSGLEVQGKDDVQDLQNIFETMELVPLVLPSTMCLFGLGDAKLAFEAKTASFARIDSLRRHIDDIHLSHYDPNVPLVCPHPSCDSSLQSVNHFKNHAATVHNVFLSK